MDPNPNNYDLYHHLKASDMTISLSLIKEPLYEGQIYIIDPTGGTFGHLLKFSLSAVRKYFFFVQEALPVRIKGIHIINTFALVDKVLAMLKPFINSELLNMIRSHSKMETVYEVIPKEMLPDEYGGNAGSLLELQKKTLREFESNETFFLEEDANLVKFDEVEKDIGSLKSLSVD